MIMRGPALKSPNCEFGSDSDCVFAEGSTELIARPPFLWTFARRAQCRRVRAPIPARIAPARAYETEKAKPGCARLVESRAAECGGGRCRRPSGAAIPVRP